MNRALRIIEDHFKLSPVAARKKDGRGGARPGAGRKPELKDPYRYTMDFEGPQMDALEAIAEERRASIASVVREAVDAYLRRRRKR